MTEALMFKTRLQLQLEKEIIFDELTKTFNVSQIDMLIKYLELERELIIRMGA